MKINKKMLNLIHHIQDLAIQIKNIHVYYQASVNFFQVYIIEDRKHTYNEHVYLDQETAIEKLEKIIKDLKERK